MNFDSLYLNHQLGLHRLSCIPLETYFSNMQLTLKEQTMAGDESIFLPTCLALLKIAIT